MSAAIVDRVAVHGENGSVLITRDRNGWYYLEARNRSGGKTVVQLHKDTVKSEEGLLDQLQRFLGATPVLPPPPPAPEPEEPVSFTDLLFAGMTEQGMNTVAVAYHLGVSVAAISSWRAGANLPRRKMLPRIAKLLDLELDTLIDAYGRATAAYARKEAA